jgi:thiamine biosynthesis lipoprotein
MLKQRFFLLCAIINIALNFTSCSGNKELSQTEFALGTVCSITLFDQGKAAIYNNIFSRLREIESRMSVNLADTDVARINAAAGIAPVQVHKDVFDVIERSVYYAEISGGAFDPTIGPLVSLWGIGKDNPRVPSQAEIDAALALINWRDVELNRESNSVFLKRPGMALDLGAIAKGYAADETAAIIRKAGLKRAIIDLGGNILTYGEKQDKSPWRVGMQDPLEERGAYLGIISSPALALVTSGIYEKFFEFEGQRYHHIFSPFDGYPARNGLLAVTIITDNSMNADALSTTVFVLGYEKGRALVEAMEGTEAVFVFDDKSIRKTEGANFMLTNEDYRLLPD